MGSLTSKKINQPNGFFLAGGRKCSRLKQGGKPVQGLFLVLLSRSWLLALQLCMLSCQWIGFFLFVPREYIKNGGRGYGSVAFPRFSFTWTPWIVIVWLTLKRLVKIHGCGPTPQSTPATHISNDSLFKGIMAWHSNFYVIQNFSWRWITIMDQLNLLRLIKCFSS